MPSSISMPKETLKPSRLKRITICLCFIAVCVVLCLAAYDARVGLWISEAAQAEFVQPDQPREPGAQLVAKMRN
jgi:hypothetical protein